MRYIAAIILCIALSSVCCSSPGMWPYPQVQVAQATAPSVVTGLSASNSPVQITDTWTTSSGATSYNVYYRQSAAPTTTTYDGKITGVSGSSYSLSGLTSGTAYYTGVTAVNGAGESAIVTTGPTTAAAVFSFTIVVQSDSLNATINGVSKGPGTYAYSGSTITAIIVGGGGSGADDDDNGGGASGSGISNNTVGSSATTILIAQPGGGALAWGDIPFGYGTTTPPGQAGSFYNVGWTVTASGSANNGSSGAPDGNGAPGGSVTGHFTPTNGATYYVFVGAGGVNGDNSAYNGGDGSVTISF